MGTGTIAPDEAEDIFFHFTAISGEGYRTLKPGTPVKFEVVKSKFGLTARNIQTQSEGPEDQVECPRRTF